MADKNFRIVIIKNVINIDDIIYVDKGSSLQRYLEIYTLSTYTFIPLR